MIVNKEMLTKYTGYFHDGGIIDIKYGESESELVISLESCYIDPEDMKDSIPLSKEETMKGKLYLIGIKKIRINDKVCKAPLRMLYNSGELLDFDIENFKVNLGIQWESFPPHPKTNEFSFIEIEVEDLYWENIPDLHDPFA